LPLFLIMIVTGMLRHSVGQLLAGAKVRAPPLATQAQGLLTHTQRLTQTGAAHYMPTSKYQARKQQYAAYMQERAEWMIAEEVRNKERAEAAAAADDFDPMANLMNPLGMLKGNMVFMVQNMIMMQGIQHFFSGFILLKVPFPLTAGFKNVSIVFCCSARCSVALLAGAIDKTHASFIFILQMFQKGMAELPDLECSYVSSISWYFLVMYGLRSFFRLAIGDPPLEVREQEALHIQLGLQHPPNPGQKQDTETIVKLLKQQAETMEVTMQDHKSEMDGVEKRLLGANYPKRRLEASDSDFLLAGATKTKMKKKK
jgi:hypothetical protein